MKTFSYEYDWHYDWDNYDLQQLDDQVQNNNKHDESKYSFAPK